MIKHVALAALLTTALLGCEHPDEPDDTAEARGAVDGRRDEERRTAREDGEDRIAGETELAMMPMPGPRTNTPGGVAAGLHDGAIAEGDARYAARFENR